MGASPGQAALGARHHQILNPACDLQQPPRTRAVISRHDFPSTHCHYGPACARLPCASQIVIFGSVAKGSNHPNDIDLFLDSGKRQVWESPGSDFDNTCASLLSLAHVHYGQLDPFIQTAMGLFVRSDTAQSWVKAKNMREIKQDIAKDGVPLLDICARLGLNICPLQAERLQHLPVADEVSEVPPHSPS